MLLFIEDCVGFLVDGGAWRAVAEATRGDATVLWVAPAFGADTTVFGDAGGAACLAEPAVFLVAGFAAGFLAAFGAAGATGLRATFEGDVLPAVFFVAAFPAAGFFAVGFLTTGLAATFFGAGLGAGFFAGTFTGAALRPAAVFRTTPAFPAAVFFATDFFATAFVGAAFLATDFFATDFAGARPFAAPARTGLAAAFGLLERTSFALPAGFPFRDLAAVELRVVFAISLLPVLAVAAGCYSLCASPRQPVSRHVCDPTATDGAGRVNAITRLILRLLAFYKRWISPLLGQRCRFHPSCSDYAREAVVRFGPWRGMLLAAWRLLRCQPLCAGGLDPVPEHFHFARCRHPGDSG